MGPSTGMFWCAAYYGVAPTVPSYLISDGGAHGNYLVQTCCPRPGLPLLDDKKQER